MKITAVTATLWWATVATGMAIITGIGLVTGLGVAPAQAGAGQRLVISEGHVDIGPRIVDGQWRFQLRDDTVSPPAWRELGDVVLQATAESAITVPAGDEYAFLGEDGDAIWVLPQAQRSGIVWPGWNTQDPSVVAAVTGDVTWTIDAVEGPGTFSLFLTGAFGAPSLLFDGSDGWPQSIPVELNTHVHGNWTFSEQGVYRMTMTIAATGTDGVPLRDTAELVLSVGDADPASVPAESATSSTGGSATARDTSGQGGAAGGVQRSNALPDTGAGYLPPLVVGAVGLLALAVLLGILARRRPGLRSRG